MIQTENPEDSLDRRVLGWSSETVRDILAWLAGNGEPEPPLFAGGSGGAGIQTGHLVYGILAALLVAVLHILWHRGSQAYLERVRSQVLGRLGKRAGSTIVAAVSIAVRGALPVAIWIALYLAYAQSWSAPYWLDLAWRVARIYATVSLLLYLLDELTRESSSNLRPAERTRVRGLIGAMVVFVVIARTLILITRFAGGRSDLIAFQLFLFHAGILFLGTLLLLNRRLVLSLFPVVENSLLFGFLKHLHRFYFIAIALTVAIAILVLLGFRELGFALLSGTWGSVLVLLGFVYLDRILASVLRRSFGSSDSSTVDVLSSGDVPGTAVLRFVRYWEILFGTILILSLTHLLGPFIEFSETSLLNIGVWSISPANIVQAIALILGFILLGLAAEETLNHKVYPRLNLGPGVGTATNTALRYIIIIVGILLGLQVSGLDLTVLTVFAGALGLGAGLGLQRVAGNLASGFILIFGRIIRKGDVVTVAGNTGMVQDVGLRATLMRSLDNIEFLVPNEELVNTTITNWTYSNPVIRVHVPVGVSYGSSPDKVKEVLLSVADDSRDVRQRPQPLVWFLGFGDSSINFELIVYMNIKNISVSQLKSNLNFEIFRRLKEAGIEIPFPQRDLHLKSGSVASQEPAPEQRSSKKGRSR